MRREREVVHVDNSDKRGGQGGEPYKEYSKQKDGVKMRCKTKNPEEERARRGARDSRKAR